VLAASILATVAGADRARVPFDARAIAETSLAAELGAGDPAAVPVALTRLTARLADFPTDAATRTILASLLLESDGEAARAAAMIEIRTAVRDDPYGVGVRCAAARIEARSGRSAEALAEVRAIFAFDAVEASSALSDVEPFVPGGRVEDAIPDDATAWLAWSRRLRALGREREADERLDASLRRWPDDLSIRAAAAEIAAGRGRLADLARLVPPGLAIPEDAGHAALIAYRARSREDSGDPAGARRDALLAAALSDDAPWILALSGDAIVGTDAALARVHRSRARFALESGREADARFWIDARLARLDEREGKASDALRRWREVLALRPDDAEAKARVADLDRASGDR